MQIQDNYTKKNVDEMMSEELARWLCLFEAIDIVALQANKMKLDLSKDNSWIKPLNFKTYIKESYFSMLDKVCHYRDEIPRFDIPAYTVFEINHDEQPLECVLEENEEEIFV